MATKADKAESLINKLRSVLLMVKNRGGRMEPFEIQMMEEAIKEYDARGSVKAWHIRRKSDV